MKRSPVRSRILSVLMVFCMILTLLPAYASAEETSLGSSEGILDSGLIPDANVNMDVSDADEQSPQPATLSDLPQSPLGISGLGGMGTQAVATATARGIVGYNEIHIRLTEGEFAAPGAISHIHWALNTAGQSIQSIIRRSDTHIQLNLSAAISTGQTFTITSVDPSQFAAGTEPFTMPLAVEVKSSTPAVGTATAAAGTKDITVTLSSGEFHPSQRTQDWILGGATAGNSISSVTYADISNVQITLENNIGPADELTVRNNGYGPFLDASTLGFDSPLTVLITGGGDGEANVCEIGSTGYASLDLALQDVPTGGAAPTTITLLDNISHDGLVIDNKKINLNPGGKILTLGKADDNTTGLAVINGGSFVQNGSGQVKVFSNNEAVTAEGTGSIAVVYSAASTNHSAAYAWNGGRITLAQNAEGKSGGVSAGKNGDTAAGRVEVYGNVTATGNNSTGAVVAAYGGQVTVNGNVTASGTFSVGVYAGGMLNTVPSGVLLLGNVTATNIGVDASGDAQVTVKKDVTAGLGVSNWAYGVRAQSRAQVTVEGNIQANDQSSSIGVHVNSTHPGETTKVIVGGAISGTTYIKLANTVKTEVQQDVPSAQSGYRTYTVNDPSFGINIVWVKDSSVLAPLDTPTGLVWDTATAGVVKAKWDAVAGAQTYQVRLYKAGEYQGYQALLETNATNAHLTAYIQSGGAGTYTFTVKALAPSGSADYADSTAAASGPYSYMANPATGLTAANAFTSSIFVTLTQGAFSVAQDKAYWTLGGSSAAANSITGVTYISSTEVQITLANNINANDQLTITADQGAFNSGTSPFTSPLTVLITVAPTFVCTINGVAYVSLGSALQAVHDNQTIILASDIRHTEAVVIEEKKITFDLNGHNLVIDTSETSGSIALKVENGSVKYRGTGNFIVCGDRIGVRAQFGSKVQVSGILIKNAGRLQYPAYDVYGAYAHYENSVGEGSEITVNGSIRTLSGNPCENAIGAFAGQDSTITVTGDIFIEGDSACGLAAGDLNNGNGAASAGNVTVTGEFATGVSAAGKSTTMVNGAVTVSGPNAVGAASGIAEDGSGGTVHVKGDVAVTGTNSIGVTCFSDGYDAEPPRTKSTVTVDGLISGHNYLEIDNHPREKNAKDSESGGYWFYNGQYGSMVKVKDPDGGGIPGGNVPSAPQSFIANPGSDQVTLSWTAPNSDGGSAITNYQVSKDSGANWTNVGLTTSYTFTGLTSGTEYTFKVRAVNGTGNGAEASTTATPTAAPTVPAVPRNLTAVPGHGQVWLDWDAPASNGGSAITTYEVSKNSGADWTVIGLNTSYTFTGLTNGTEYTFRVRAVNGAGNGAEASVSAMPTDFAHTAYTINFYSNGSLYASKSVTNGSALGNSWPSNPTRSDYIFKGWFTSQNGTGTQYTSSTVIIFDVDLYADWMYDGGSSSGDDSGSSSGGGASTPATSTEKQPDMPTTAKMGVTGTAEDDILSVAITEQMVKDAIKAAQDAAKKSGKEADGITLDFNVTGSGSYASLNATIDAAAIDRLKEAGVKFIKIGSSVLDVTLDMGSIAEIDRQSTGTVTVSATRLTKLSDAAKKLIGNRPVFNITVSYQKNRKTEYITNFGKGTVTLGIAYKAADKEKTGNLFGVYVDKNGKPQLLTNSSYDNGRLIFSRNSLSTYGVGYKTPAPAFTDTAKHWAKDNIDFVASRGLINGTSAVTFAPNTAITRADFLMALGKLSGADVTVYTSSSFTDVKDTDTAMPYIEWAVKNKITQGIEGGKFGPALSITRQDMAVMMQNYAKATGYKLPASVAAVIFSDSVKISAYARDGVKAIQQAGIMQSKGSNTFDPQAGTTRAEAATILRRFVELIIDEGTARGWVQNDVGQWQYIDENGKPVTGWLIAENGKYHYYLDKDGIMISGKWLEIDGKWYYFYADGSLAKSTKIGDYEVDENGVRKTK